jgi:hypothetical protein
VSTSPAGPAAGSTGPLVIGGLGGSGTRLVAEIVQELGCFLGDDLNQARDNLWFTLLFKRPRWYAEAMARDPQEVKVGFRILERAMVARGELDYAAFSFLGRAVREAMLGRHGQTRAFTPGWPLAQSSRLVRALRFTTPHEGPWGWKEPNSHVYLRPMAEHWPGLKFIYVVRHGLDMAFSRNQTQLHLWGPLFGVQPSAAPGVPQPQAMLDYWIKAAERATTDGRRLLGKRFMVLNYDTLATAPNRVLPGLIDFLELDPRGLPLDRIRALAVPAASSGRYRQHDLSTFDERSLDAVRSMGWAVD